jgi:hypothetical protein
MSSTPDDVRIQSTVTVFLFLILFSCCCVFVRSSRLLDCVLSLTLPSKSVKSIPQSEPNPLPRYSRTPLSPCPQLNSTVPNQKTAFLDVRQALRRDAIRAPSVGLLWRCLRQLAVGRRRSFVGGGVRAGSLAGSAGTLVRGVLRVVSIYGHFPVGIRCPIVGLPYVCSRSMTV